MTIYAEAQIEEILITLNELGSKASHNYRVTVRNQGDTEDISHHHEFGSACDRFRQEVEYAQSLLRVSLGKLTRP